MEPEQGASVAAIPATLGDKLKVERSINYELVKDETRALQGITWDP
ncbi:MAG: hypothetical protein H6816_08255 [Phycisphaerales bacterium]|nr:hypothetical protein [Phycisphaerales bacterium]